MGGVTTYYVGAHFEWTTFGAVCQTPARARWSSITTPAVSGACPEVCRRMAMRRGNPGTLSFLLGDHGFRRRKLGIHVAHCQQQRWQSCGIADACLVGAACFVGASSVGWNALHLRDHAHDAALYRANRGRGHRLVPFGNLRAGLLQCTLLRQRARPLHPGGYDCAESGQSAESQPVCVHPQ